MCPACFWRLLPLISKSYWNKEMRIMGKPNKPVELWSLSTWCFKPFLEIYISVQFKSQMEFFFTEFRLHHKPPCSLSWYRTGRAAEIKFIIKVHGSEVCLKLAAHLHILCLALSQCFKSQTSTNAPAHQIYSSERYLTSLKSVGVFVIFFSSQPHLTQMPTNSLQSVF